MIMILIIRQILSPKFLALIVGRFHTSKRATMLIPTMDMEPMHRAELLMISNLLHPLLKRIQAATAQVLHPLMQKRVFDFLEERSQYPLLRYATLFIVGLMY